MSIREEYSICGTRDPDNLGMDIQATPALFRQDRAVIVAAFVQMAERLAHRLCDMQGVAGDAHDDGDYETLPWPEFTGQITYQEGVRWET